MYSSVSRPFVVSQSGEMASGGAAKVRVVADPSIGVSDLEQVLEGFVNGFPEGSKPNLFELLRPPPGYHWKSAPCPKYLCKTSKCLAAYFAIAQNGVLPSKKHKAAIAAVDRKLGLNSTRKSEADFCDCLDDWVRMSLAHVRGLKACEIARARCYRKADSVQQEALDLLLGAMGSLGPDLEEDPASSTALVPYTGPGPVSRTVSSSSLPEVEKVDPAKIFADVLREDGEAIPVVSLEASLPKHVSPKKKLKTATDHFLAGLLATLDECEIELLETVDKKQPAEIKKPPPKPKAKAKAKAGAKAKGKAVAKPKGKAGAKKQAAVGAVSEEEDAKEQPSAQCSQQSQHPPADEETPKISKGKPSDETQAPQTTGQKDGEQDCAEKIKKRPLPDHEIDLVKLRKRVTSRAYHSARCKAIAGGLSADEAKVMAQKASAAASSQFEKDYKKQS